MQETNYYYPIALIVIIGGALYFLTGNLFNAGNIDMSRYQKVCEQYLAAKPGEVSQDAMKSYVYKVDYLIPTPINELTDPLEKSVKICAQKINEKMVNVVVVE